MSEFTEALEQHDREQVRKVPKADLHNNFVLGGDRKYMEQKSGVVIKPIMPPFFYGRHEQMEWTVYWFSF